MKRRLSLFIFCYLKVLLFPIWVFGNELTYQYAILDPTSISQHVAFYELYPETEEGRKALEHAWSLLAKQSIDTSHLPSLSLVNIAQILSLLQFSKESLSSFSPLEMRSVVQVLKTPLKHHTKKGHALWDLDALLTLDEKEFDFTRALLLTECSNHRELIESYEACLDLLALQILAKLPENATDAQKIDAMNEVIFHEIGFRFPPHSLYAKNIDLYTFLPSVLEKRQGVCLGVSILYLCLAERVGLELEIITPPGHIYVRHVDSDGIITNIETTCRGVDVPSAHYLSINTKSLKKRSIKEVIGLSLFNQASTHWYREDYLTAIKIYERAQKYLKDPLLDELLAFCHLFAGHHIKGLHQLYALKQSQEPDQIFQNTSIQYYLLGRVDLHGLKIAQKEVDATRDSIIGKQKHLEQVIQRFPRFRQGWLQLAITHLQLSENKHALSSLETYIALAKEDPTAHYYLSSLYLEREDLAKAWKHLHLAEQLTHTHHHYPHALFLLRKTLEQQCLEPSF